MNNAENKVLDAFREAVKDNEFYSKVINDKLYLYRLFMCEAGRISLERIRGESNVL